jgi:hypothetical protein
VDRNDLKCVADRWGIDYNYSRPYYRQGTFVRRPLQRPASDPATATEADIQGTAAVGVRDGGAYEFVGPYVKDALY